MGDQLDDQQHNEPSPRKMGRGIAKLNNITIRQGSNSVVERIPVQFDDNCNPIGANGANGANFIIYIGIVVRRRISILKDNWNHFSNDDKQQWVAEIRVCIDLNYYFHNMNFYLYFGNFCLFLV